MRFRVTTEQLRRHWKEAALFWMAAFAIAFCFGKLWEFAQWHIVRTGTHVEAVVVRTWMENPKRGRHQSKWARLAFTRIQNGKAIPCTISLNVYNFPKDLQEVGARIELVPWGYGCFNPVIPILLK